ncbi:MAG: signal peptidase I [Firmicutes bacterium]|nr:signal peptidase I [Bacillota bacterium]
MAKARKFGKYDKKKFEWIRTFEIVVITAALVVAALLFIVGTSRVDGQSMVPTLKDSQLVGYLRVGNDYEKGDIVAIKMPSGDRYVKRIIATEGETIDIREGNVYVDGQKLDEPYIQGVTWPDLSEQSAHITYPYKVEAGKYFVMGDNREHSTDSRRFGAVVKGSIRGKLLFQK